jgi:hypothetical protein
MHALIVACLFPIFALMCVAEDSGQPMACNLKAISPAERPRYNELVKRLRASVSERIELAEGFKYKLNSKVIALPEVAEWITMERLCCPFLTFQLDVTSKGDHHLTLRGPSGAKAIIQEEFPAPPRFAK